MSTKNYNLDFQNKNIQLQEILDEINNLPEAGGGGIDTSDATATASDILKDKTAYVNGEMITGTIAFQEAKIITPGTANQIAISKGYYANGSVTVAGDSNLKASNIKNGTSIFGVEGVYEGSGGNTDIEDAFVTKTLTTYENDRVTIVGDYAFYFCENLTSVDFPVCTSIGDSAFYRCKRLLSVNFPACVNIGSSAFCYCINLTSANFPSCTNMASYAFSYCSNLISANFPVCTSIGSNTFYSCRSLTSINFPVCTSIGSSAFCYCVELPAVKFPACTIIGNYAFSFCSKLTSGNFPVCTSIGGSAFYSCSKLTNLTLGASSVATLANARVFYSTPMSISTLTGSFGSIYVPHPLVNLYKSATNWTTYANRIVGMETEQCISFIIDGDEFWAFEGMTWGNLLTGLYYSGTLGEAEPGRPCHMTPGPEYGGAFAYITANSTPVSTSDTIIANYSYGLKGIF